MVERRAAGIREFLIDTDRPIRANLCRGDRDDQARLDKRDDGPIRILRIFMRETGFLCAAIKEMEPCKTSPRMSAHAAAWRKASIVAWYGSERRNPGQRNVA